MSAIPPITALHFYPRYVAFLISQHNRQAYEQATQIHIRMHALYEKLGKHDIWTCYITRLRERHRSLKAFQNVLSASGLSRQFERGRYDQNKLGRAVCERLRAIHHLV